MDKKQIKEIVSKMTLEQKAAMTTGHGDWQTYAIPELNVKPMWMSDGPNGLRKQPDMKTTVKSTSFPCACAVAASFDPKIAEKEGHEIGKICQSENVNMILGPGVCIKRSPMCGRDFEYYSEDPFLAGKMGVGFIKGVQKEGVGTSLKHYLANSQETRRMSSSSNVDERTLREIYLPAFEACVKEAQPTSIMASYNKINETYATANKYFITDILRKEWGFKGLVVSDWGATHDRVAVIKAGTDLTMPTDPASNHLIVEAVNSGKLKMRELDKCCERVIRLADKTVSTHKDGVKVDPKDAHQIAEEMEEGSIVLLKNDNNILPLKEGKKIAIVGSFADQMRYGGGGSAAVQTTLAPSFVKFVEGKNNFTYDAGYKTVGKLIPESADSAVKHAKEAEVAVVFLSQFAMAESEGYDRWTMDIPADEIALLNRIKAVQPNVIVVLENGAPVTMPWLEQANAVLDIYLGGEGVDEALYKVLFGKVNPSGRLPETFPLKVEDNPSYLGFMGEKNEVAYPEGVFVGYRYYETKKMPVLFPFGYGLSYTDFEYSNLKVSLEAFKSGDELKVTVDVKNIGHVKGKEVVQLYVGVGLRDTTFMRPVRELRGFEKISLAPGETKTVEFTLGKRAFACYDVKAKDFRIAGGTYEIQICKNSHEVILAHAIKVEDEHYDIKEHYDYASVIADVLENPKAHPFIDKALATANAILEKMGYNNMTSDPDTKEVMLEAAKTTGMGLEGQVISLLKMFTTGAVSDEEWDKLFKDLNS